MATMQSTELKCQPQGPGKPITINGVVYLSRSAAARHFRINVATFINRLRLDWTPEQAAEQLDGPEHYKSKPITIADVTYLCMSKAARHFGIDETDFSNRLAAGWTPDQAAGLGPLPASKKSIPITVGGVVYPSKNAAARHFGVGATTFAARINRGCTPDQAAGLES